MEPFEQALEEKFLEYLIVGHRPVTIFLTNGVKLSGTITKDDTNSMALSRDGITQLVMKQAVATIMPQDAFSIYDVVGE